MPAGRPKRIEAEETIQQIEPVINDDKILSLQRKLTELNIPFNETDDFMTLVNLLANLKDRTLDNFRNYESKTYLKNKEFVKRLYNLGVPAFYISPIIDQKNPDVKVYLFTDNDDALDDNRLREKVRFCKFMPVDFQSIMSSYAKQPLAQRMR